MRRFLPLVQTSAWVLLRALIWLAFVDVALRFAAYRHRMGLVTPALGVHDAVPTTEELRRARHYAYWIDVASRHSLVRAYCLHRSLVLCHWLRREGLQCDLQIGVLLVRGRLKAHAWVEMGGETVNDPPGAVAVFTRLERGQAPSLELFSLSSQS